MRVATAPETLPRADRPWEPDGGPGFFAYAETDRQSLAPAFVLLQVYLLLSLSAVDEHFAVIGALRPRLLLGLLVLTAAVLQGLRAKAATGEGLTVRNTQSRWLVAFILTGMSSTLWAYDAGAAREPFIAHMLSVLTYMLILALVHTRREFLITLLTFCAGSGLFIVLSLWEWFHGRYDFTMGVLRMQGAGSMYQDPNSFGATILFALPIFVWVGLHASSNFIRFGAAAYGIMAAYCTIKTSSRSALVLFVLTGLWALAALPRASQRVLGVLVLCVASLALASTLSPSQAARIQSLASSDTYEREGSTRGRIEGYVVGYEMLKQNPLLGVGPGNWSSYRLRKMDGRVLHAHNLFGSLVAERGLTGSLAFLAFLLTSVLFGWRAMRRLRTSSDGWDQAVARFCFAMLCVYALLLVSGLGAHNLDRPNWYAASALMIVAVGCRRASSPLSSGGSA